MDQVVGVEDRHSVMYQHLVVPSGTKDLQMEIIDFIDFNQVVPQVLVLVQVVL